MTTAYIGAPMRGIPDHNHPLLFAAQKQLEAQYGWTVLNPAQHELDWSEDYAHNDADLPQLMWWDLDQVINSDKVIFLPGWEKSEGCGVERKLAHMLDKEVYFYDPDAYLPRLIPDSVGDPRFHQLLHEIGTLHDKKQSDYGTGQDPFANVRASEFFGIPAWVGSLMRLNDKVHRLQNYAQKGVLENESAEDSMMDIAVYALIALVLYREASA